MPSLRKILYIIGTVTDGDDTKYMSVKDVCLHINDNEDERVTINRVFSQVNAHKNLFATKRIGKNVLWRLNLNGKKYLNKFKDFYDPNTDRLLFQPDKIEVF